VTNWQISSAAIIVPENPNTFLKSPKSRKHEAKTLALKLHLKLRSEMLIGRNTTAQRLFATTVRIL